MAGIETNNFFSYNTKRLIKVGFLILMSIYAFGIFPALNVFMNNKVFGSVSLIMLLGIYGLYLAQQIWVNK